MQPLASEQLLEARHLRLFGQQVGALRLVPVIRQLRVGQPDVGRAGRIAAVLQVIDAAVEDLRALHVGVEEDRAERVVLIVENDAPRRCLLQGRGERLAAQVRVEGDHGDARRVEQQHHRERDQQIAHSAGLAEGRQRGDGEGQSGQQERQLEVGEGGQRQVAHVAQRERVHLGMLRQRPRDVAGRGHAPDIRQNENDAPERERADCAEHAVPVTNPG